MARERPPVSLIVPFGEGAAEAEAIVAALELVSLRPGDELIVVDNSERGAVAATKAEMKVIEASGERSSYYARNVGAEAATGEWLLFVDADCRPPATLLDDYLEEPVPDPVGVLAGGVESAPEQTGLLARYARSREHISERWHIERGPYPSGVTANLMIRRVTWEAMGGFHEGIRSGGDVEFCLRAQEAGWALEHRPQARVEHVHPERLRPMLRKATRHATGQVWVNRRYPGYYQRPRPVRELARAVFGGAFFTLTGRFERGVFKLIDGLRTWAATWGFVTGDNRARRPHAAPSREAIPSRRARGLVVFADQFPVRSETFVYNEVRALRELGWNVRVESSGRPSRVERDVVRELDITQFEDEPIAGKVRDLAWLLIRHPQRSFADWRDRGRWRAEEDVWPLASLASACRRLAEGGERHIHAHFAAAAALHAMRVGRMLGIPYSLTAHAYDIFQRPRNLREKMEAASFVAAECDYTASYLSELVGPQHAGRIHRVATGVDADAFHRRGPYPGGATVVAVGRLIEKKGFAHLLDAVAKLGPEGRLERVVVAGDGPLRDDLAVQVERLGIGHLVELRGNVWGADAVRELLESADLLCVPSVIAPDGDRDALPVVVYEALAMELPVVASELAGLPEVVKDGWGALVPPGDTGALADAISRLLSMPAERRAEMGAAGREFVLVHGNRDREVARLAGLIDGAEPPSDDLMAGPRE